MIIINGVILEEKTFPNGEFLLELPSFAEAETINIMWKYQSDSEFLRLNLVSDFLRTNAPEVPVTLHVGYMPYSRMDRRDPSGNPFSLAIAVKMLPTNWSYVVYEPHSDKTVELLTWRVESDKTVYAVYPTASLLSQARYVVGWLNYNAILFPDKGAKKRYTEQVDLPIKNMKVLVGEKKREFGTGKIESLEILDEAGNIVEELHGYNVLIVDDLSSYGGTFVRASRKLKELGVDKVSLVVTHAENVIYSGNLLNNIEYLFTTTSILDLTMKPINDNIIVTPIEDIMEKYIRDNS